MTHRGKQNNMRDGISCVFVRTNTKGIEPRAPWARGRRLCLWNVTCKVSQQVRAWRQQFSVAYRPRFQERAVFLLQS